MHKIEIIINDQKAAEGKKTAVFPRRRPYKLGRRRLSRKVYVNVFDMQRYANGSDVDLYSFKPEPDTPYFVFYNGSITLGNVITLAMVDTSTAAYMATWNDSWLSVPEADLADTFLNITEDLDDYDIEISGFSNFQSGKGLYSTTNEQSLQVAADTNLRDQWFMAWPLSGGTPRDVYYTLLPDPDADIEPLVIDRDCDVFLTPTTLGGRGVSGYETGGTFPLYGHQYYFVQRPVSRSVTLNNADWDNLWANKTNHPGITEDAKDLLRSYKIDDPDGETYRLRADNSSGSQTIDADNPVQLPGTDFLLTSEHSPWAWTPKFHSRAHELNQGHLVAIVRKHLSSGYEYYYAWADNTWIGGLGIQGLEI